MRRALAVLVIAAIAAGGPATTAGAIAEGRYAIGDSVMLGAKAALQGRGFIVDVKTSRQFSEAVTIVKRKAASGVLRRKVIVHLGTNGILIQASQCDQISKYAGSKRRVYLVTVTGPTKYPKIRKAQNIRLHACADRHANTYLIDWYAYSRGHASWFWDGMHLTSRGRSAYAAFLDSKTS
jgi:hypothetical protein